MPPQDRLMFATSDRTHVQDKASQTTLATQNDSLSEEDIANLLKIPKEEFEPIAGLRVYELTSTWTKIFFFFSILHEMFVFSGPLKANFLLTSMLKDIKRIN